MEFDVVVVGGGLAGTSLAVALRRTQRKVALVEAAAPRRSEGWDSRVYAVSAASRAFLARHGVWEHLDSGRIEPVAEMDVCGDADGQLRFTAYEAGVDALAWIVESSHLHMELWETLKRQHNATLFCPTRAQALSFDGDAACLTLEDGRRLRARLLVAADGAQSWVREQTDISASISPYDELGVVANFRCERPHRGIARQWFREDGILAWLPLPEDQISIVWSAPEARARALLALDPTAFSETVAEAGERALGTLTQATPAAAFPLRLMRVSETVRPRLALIGDAAHAIHPLSGHGINLGFSDAESLAARIEALPAWRDPGELAVLRAYARARAEEPVLMQAATHALNRVFKTRNPFLRMLRNHGMNLTDRVPVVRSALVRYATSGKF